MVYLRRYGSRHAFPLSVLENCGPRPSPYTSRLVIESWSDRLDIESFQCSAVKNLVVDHLPSGHSPCIRPGIYIFQHHYIEKTSYTLCVHIILFIDLSHRLCVSTSFNFQWESDTLRFLFSYSIRCFQIVEF